MRDNRREALKPGYYWVKVKRGEWRIAHLFSDGLFMIDGMPYKTSNFSEIDERPILREEK